MEFGLNYKISRDARTHLSAAIWTTATIRYLASVTSGYRLLDKPQI